MTVNLKHDPNKLEQALGAVVSIAIVVVVFFLGFSVIKQLRARANTAPMLCEVELYSGELWVEFYGDGREAVKYSPDKKHRCVNLYGGESYTVEIKMPPGETVDTWLSK
jgi:hypothetical protein